MQVAFFPYETRGMLDICDGILEVFSLACDASRAPSSSAPPCWGGTWLFDHHGFLLTVDIYGDDSVHGDSLDKLI